MSIASVAMGAAIALAAVVIGFVFGQPVAGGADSYGYVSQAHLWRRAACARSCGWSTSWCRRCRPRRWFCSASRSPSLRRRCGRRGERSSWSRSWVSSARGVAYAKARWAFNNWGGRRFEVIGKAIAQRLPENAVMISFQHSGSVRYYAGRDIVRYDLVPPHRLDRFVKRLRRGGHHPFVVLDSWEVAEYRRRFEGRSPLAALDWPPLYELEHVEVRVWDVLDRARRVPSRNRDTELLPWPYPR